MGVVVKERNVSVATISVAIMSLSRGKRTERMSQFAVRRAYQ